MSKCFTANRLALNLDKTNIIQVITNKSPQNVLNIGYNGKYIEESVNMKFLGFQVDNYLNWTKDTDLLSPMLNGSGYAVRCMICISNTNTLKSVYFACFHSTMKYGVIFGSNSSNSKIIFTLQKKTFGLMAGVKSRNLSKSVFKGSEILTLPRKCILSLISFTVNNQDIFKIIFLNSVAIQGIRISFIDQLPASHVFRRMLIMLASKFPTVYHLVINLINKKAQFKVALKICRITHSFYSIDELLVFTNNA
jgi:hypothetical protein